MNILVLEPFFTGSHQQWVEGWQKNSQHKIEVVSLPGKFWKWRMFGGALSLAEKAVQLDFEPDVLVVSDMLDLGTFLAYWLKKRTAPRQTVLYFHENQITYPWQEGNADTERNEQYGFINFTSAVLADQLWFNSDFHRRSFLEALHPFLKKYPDHRHLHLIPNLKSKASTKYLGLDLAALDHFQDSSSGPAVLLWNHRWEYDKDPETFFRLCFNLQAQGIDFRLIVLGESYARQPEIFDQAKAKLASKILHWGYAESREAYIRWLWKGDILPVTSQQDFFGGAAVEAIYCMNYPLLPNRLAFPEHLPEEHSNLYKSYEDLLNKCKDAILNVDQIRSNTRFRTQVSRYDWSSIAPAYDRAVTPSEI